MLVAAYRVPCVTTECTPYMFVNRMYFYRFITNDRFDFLTKYSLIDWKPCGEAISPQVFSMSYDINELIDCRARELLDKGKKIYVLYSGGVDSTTVVTALLKNKLRDEQVEVVGTKESVKENLFFADFLSKHHIPFHVLDWHNIMPFIESQNDYIVTNGWGADQLFHFGMASWRPELFNKDWVEGTKIVYSERGQYDYWRYNANSIEILRDYLDHVFPAPIRTFSYYCWFWNFCMKYTFIRNVTSMEANTEYLRQNNYPFFITTDFSNWAASRWEWFLHNSYAEPRCYKPELKAYTVDFTKDESFWDMTKTQSWDPMYETVTKSRLTVIDDTGFKNFGEMDENCKYNIIMSHYKKEYL